MTGGEIGFDGQAIVITGGGRGIGRAVAMLLAARGARIVVADSGAAMDGRDTGAAPADEVVAEIRAEGGKAIAYQADLVEEAGAAGAVEVCVESFGRIDGILHGASSCPDLVSADQLVTNDLELAMRVNAHAGLWLARTAWPHMVTQGYGRVVFMTSGAIYGADGNAPYAAAKAANVGLMRCLAPEGKRAGILVNAISPAAHTRMTDRFHPSAYADWFYKTMTPEKVAAGAGYLLSGACSVHGEIVVLGGGRIARITLAETQGFMGAGGSIEDVRNAMPHVMSDSRFFHPADLTERSAKVSELFGFNGVLEATGTFAVRPIGHD